MVMDQSKITGRLITITEVLREKGHFCDEDIKQMFERIEAQNEQRARAELDEARAELVSKKREENQQDSSKADAEGDSLRSPETGTNEDSVGS